MWQSIHLASVFGATIFAGQFVLAQEESFPDSFGDFLKAGTKIAVRAEAMEATESNGLYTVTIFSDAAFELARDSRSMSLTKLREKYSRVDASAKHALEDYSKKLAERSAILEPDREYAPPEIDIVPDRNHWLYRVLHRGEDYVLLAWGENELQRRVLPLDKIAGIFWSDGMPRLQVQAKIVEKD